MIRSFSIKPLPRIVFGAGQRGELAAILSMYGKSTLVLTGGNSFIRSDFWQQLQQSLTDSGINYSVEKITEEPSPERIDTIVARYHHAGLQSVVAIGGGSVLDAGKAVSAMLPGGRPVLQFLEGVGDQAADGRKLPFVAVPTTSGTGSEATSNAVLRRVGEGGFKKSLRHDNYVPDVAVVDPELTVDCPRKLTTNCAMDAFTQLVESYLSTKASAFTDDLAWGALVRMRQSLLPVCRGEAGIAARGDLAYAALVSGITLANAGLGLVHGFASVIGGLAAIPHGVVCGTLMAAANELSLRELRRSTASREALAKYARLGQLFSDKKGQGPEYYQDAFIDALYCISAELEIDLLSDYGITGAAVANIARDSNCKNNPAVLGLAERQEILLKRIA